MAYNWDFGKVENKYNLSYVNNKQTRCNHSNKNSGSGGQTANNVSYAQSTTAFI